jgi:uncharacterized protein
MLVRVNQHVKLSHDMSTGINVLEGKVLSIPSEARERLALLCRNGSSPILSTDLPLLEDGILRTDGAAEHEILQLNNRIAQYLKSHGALCIMPTEKCNFRCTYCYEKFEKGRMSDELVTGVKRFLEFEIDRLPFYSLGWFGGEPLLQPRIIHSVTKHFHRIQETSGSQGSVAITTNGSLLKGEALKLMKDAEIDLYHISVDGPAEVHNRQRPTIGGRDTYAEILENISSLLDCTQSRIIFRVNVQTDKPDAAELVTPWLIKEIVPRFNSFGGRITYHIESVWDATTTGVDGICISDLQRFQLWFDIRSSIMREVGIDPLTALASDVSNIGSLACYAGKPNHYVVGADGQVYKCTVALDLPENHVGSLDSSGRMVIDPLREALWIGQNSLTDSGCGACAFHASCLGIACPLTRLQTGQPPCPTEKVFIGEILRVAAPV